MAKPLVLVENKPTSTSLGEQLFLKLSEVASTEFLSNIKKTGHRLLSALPDLFADRTFVARALEGFVELKCMTALEAQLLTNLADARIASGSFSKSEVEKELLFPEALSLVKLPITDLRRVYGWPTAPASDQFIWEHLREYFAATWLNSEEELNRLASQAMGVADVEQIVFAENNRRILNYVAEVVARRIVRERRDEELLGALSLENFSPREQRKPGNTNSEKTGGTNGSSHTEKTKVGSTNIISRKQTSPKSKKPHGHLTGDDEYTADLVTVGNRAVLKKRLQDYSVELRKGNLRRATTKEIPKSIRALLLDSESAYGADWQNNPLVMEEGRRLVARLEWMASSSQEFEAITDQLNLKRGGGIMVSS